MPKRHSKVNQQIVEFDAKYYLDFNVNILGRLWRN